MPLPPAGRSPDEPAAPPAPSRREFLRRGPLGAAIASTAALVGATTGSTARAAVPTLRADTIPVLPDTVPVPADTIPTAAASDTLSFPTDTTTASLGGQPVWLIDPTEDWESWPLRLARRVTLGLTLEEAQRARALGYYGYLEYQLAYESIDDTACESVVASRYPLLAQQGTDLYNVATGTLQSQLQESTLYRSAFSKRQLYQRMVEFWSDHFNISFTKVGYLKLIDDRDVIRKNALGSFPTLLKASAHSGAMLVYLDQQASRRQAPNQNYARELMELHTLGVDGGYTQTDVAELSRALTGWSIAGRGDFAFTPSLHDYTAKTILGVPLAAMNSLNQTNPLGIQDGEKMLDVLVAHPSTASFISKKMLRWLLWYEPTQAMIDRVAGVYLQTQGDIKSMVRACLDFSMLQQAPAKLKRPFHWLASTLRATSATGTSVANASRLLTSLGHQQFMWDTPDGYPDQLEYWAGNLLPRWNAATSIANSNSDALRVDVAPLQALGTADAVAAGIGAWVFGGEMGDRTRAQLVAYLRPSPTNATRIREALALALSSSSFQWY